MCLCVCVCVTLTLSYFCRIDEEDDRMKAIQDGKAAVEKEYTTLGTSISTEGGSLDIAKLADPNAISGTAEPANPPTATSPRKVYNMKLKKQLTFVATNNESKP